MKPILISSENPEGIPLQDLLVQLQDEIHWKINKVIDKSSPQAVVVVNNNLKILEHLGAALALQNASQAVLNAIGPDQGPTGQPRI